MVGSVLNNGARAQYTALAAQTDFAYPFRIFADGDLDVWQTAAGATPDPTLDLLTLNVDYTVTGAGDPGGGDIVLIVAASVNDIITIERNVPIERTFDYSVGGEFTALSINQQLDKLTMTQQQNQMVNEERQVTYSPTDVLDGSNDLRLPQLATGQFWKKGDAGGLVAVTLEESAGWSALRSELANELTGTDGSRIVGYYDSHTGSTTVHDVLEILNTKIGHYAVTAGTEPNYTATITGITSYFAGLTISVKIHSPNTAAATLNINGLGAKNLVNSQGAALASGDLGNQIIYTFIYQGSEFILSNLQPASTTSRGLIRLATAAEVKTGTNSLKAVVPSTMTNHQGVAKAWVAFDGLLTATIRAQYNVSSVSRLALGQYRITFANPMASVNYAVLATGSRVPGFSDVALVTTYATTHVDITTVDMIGNDEDSKYVNVVIYGDLP